jgi:hypothetical protein
MCALGIVTPSCGAHDACARRQIRGAWDPGACALAGCPRSSLGDAASGCSCAGNAVLVAGACVSPAFADSYCGKGAHYRDGGCVFVACAENQILDVAAGACVPSRTARELAAADHVAIFAHERLACTPPASPIIDGARVACLPATALCPRGTRLAPNGARCDPGIGCRAGEIPDPDRRRAPRCIPLLTESARAAYAIDVGTWTSAVLGVDGGEGSADVCQPLALRAASLPVEPKRALDARITIELRFPEGDVTLARARVVASDAKTGAPLSDVVIARVDESVRGLVDALRALGGEASVAATKTTVHCKVEVEDRPFGRPMSTAEDRPRTGL